MEAVSGRDPSASPDIDDDLNADLCGGPYAEPDDQHREWEWPLHPLTEKVLTILDRRAQDALKRWKTSSNFSGFIQWRFLKPQAQRDFARIYSALVRDPGYVNREIQRIVMCASLPVNEMMLARMVAVSAGWFVWSNLYLEPLG